MNDEVCEVVITGPRQEWVAAFTRQLVDDHLAGEVAATVVPTPFYDPQGARLRA